MGKVIYLNKPKGLTSFDVCFKLRKVFNTKKIGHIGTLDPNATGVMVILIDNATKANQFLVSATKEYVAEVKIGIKTSTLDIDGEVTQEKAEIMPLKEEVISVLNSFLGKSIQTPPLTSAIKVNGKKLYEYQREGKEVEIPKREIEVFNIELIDIKEDTFIFKTLVSSGTYIRSLMNDILDKLDIIGTLNNLERTKIDEIDISDCDSLDDVIDGKYHERNLYDLLSKRYEVIKYDNEKDILDGKRIKIDSNNDEVLIVNQGKVLSIYKRDGLEYKCVRGLF